ncbi:TonB-dependent receptor [Tenacibaculum retecalamus]|uniref:TonB-dependent receptor n=1 Tax=Tenacibaculum retecalamus TaxID=3018315 RepID=UPI0023D93998|nr:TonB-dependent receptor [Tenacibaculum retecalamus]WBX72381.1 TonB-dependent receptor [Tenacibaculum retecalamus]
MKLKSILFILLLTTAVSLVKAQNCSYTFSGLVEDFHDKSVIVNATVFIKNQNKYTTTNFDGKFTINNVCAGKIIVEISHVSCDKKILELDVSKNIYKVIDLEHHIEELNEVNVKGTTGLKTKTSQETLLKTNTLEKFSAASLGDVIKNISGVSSINTGSTIVKPIINGLHSSRVLTTFNGVRLQDQEWGIEHAPNIDINAAGSISVIKGANALQYGGDAIGGVIIVNPSKIILKDTLFGKTIASQQSNGKLFSISSSLHKSYKKGWFINGQASFKRAGDFETPSYNLTNTGLNSKAFTLHTGYKKFNKGFEIFYSNTSNKIGILRASHIGNVSDLVSALNSDVPFVTDDFSYTINNPKQEVTHQLLKAKVYKRLKGVGKLSFQYDYQQNERLEFDVRKGDKKFIAATNLLLKTHSFKSDLNLDANKENTYKFGVSGAFQNNFSNPNSGVKRIIPDYNKYNLNAYAITDFRFDKIVLNAGVRYDFEQINAKKYYGKTRWNSLNYQQEFGHLIINELSSAYLVNPIFTYHNISASIGGAYSINDENTFLVNYGLSNRAPNASELFSDGLHHSAARIELGDLRMQPETSNRFSATYKYNNQKFNVALEGFYNYVTDFIYIEPTGIETTLRGAFPVWSYKQTNAHLLGLDTSIKYHVNTNFNINNKTSFIKGRDLTNKKALIDIPAFKTTTTLFFKKENWKNFYASLESEFNAKQNEYPNNNFMAFIPDTNTHELVDISTPPKAYHLLNFSSGFEFNISQTKVNLNFSIDNVLNQSYRNYLNRLRLYADDLGRNFQIQIKINY